MTQHQAIFERGMDRIIQAIDRGSSVSLSVQLRGALEFGIASGELPADARLPSVRALAARLKISPVTVSNVYAALQASGLVDGRVGSGTFVSGGGSRATDGRFRQLDQQIAELLTLAKSCGVSASELAVRISMTSTARPRPVRILMVGNFTDATRAPGHDDRPPFHACHIPLALFVIAAFLCVAIIAASAVLPPTLGTAAIAILNRTEYRRCAIRADGAISRNKEGALIIRF